MLIREIRVNLFKNKQKMQKIKTALLSYGMSGKIFHAPFLELHPGFELLGSWERSKKLIQEDYPEVKSFPSLESILEDRNYMLVRKYSLFQRRHG